MKGINNFALNALWLAGANAAAFVASPPALSRHRSAASISALAALNNESGSTRREVLVRSTAIVGAASALVNKPSSARAATAAEVATGKTLPSSVVSNTLCDPSVSTWVKTYDDSNSMRTVHILGTAHISSSSAEMAGQMVRELKPNVVFVELDAKRVARAIPGGVNGGGSASGNNADSSSTGSTPTTSLANDTPSGSGGTEPTPAAKSATTSTPNYDAPPTKSNPFDVQSKLVNVGSKYVGNAVKGMYGKLESEGFKAGDEFAMSVREGLAIGSTIVLGDRDVEVTLRRLTQALAKTDIRKLLSADSEVNSSMEQLLPENMKNQLKQQQTNGGTGSGGSNSMNVSGMGTEEMLIDKGEFNTFIETMKAKENVKTIMRGLKSTAPEIYEAMVAERDRYMARGLDELGDTLKGSPVDSTVAVMGMAHVDGVETYLASKGWKELTYPCPVVR